MRRVTLSWPWLAAWIVVEGAVDVTIGRPAAYLVALVAGVVLLVLVLTGIARLAP